MPPIHTPSRRRSTRAVALAALVGCLSVPLFPAATTASAAPPAPKPHPKGKTKSGLDLKTQLPSPPKPPSSKPVSPKPRRGAPAVASPTSTTSETRTGTGSVAAALSPSATTWGTGTQKTLVLYDTDGDYGWLGELYGIAAGNLASHFGQVTAMPVNDYTAGTLGQFTAAIYTGSTYNQPLPASFISDVTSGTTPVIWNGFNVWQLGGTSGSTQATEFIQKYGWDSTTSYIDTTDVLPAVTYKDKTLTRDTTNNAAGIVAPHIITPSAVTVLASATCGSASAPTTCAPIAQTTGTSVPWAIRSANLTYVGEIPFAYMSESDRYLAFADLLYAPLGAGRTASKQAAVRLEDVSPGSDPNELKAAADYLSRARVPFQVAVIPRYVDPTGVYNDGVPVDLTLAQAPAVVSALRYMQSKGGTLIQHGTTHQYGTLNNPYNGVTGDDFEFFRSQCSTTPNPPLTFVPCTDTTWVQLLGPLDPDTAAGTATRVNQGRSLMTAAGLRTPTVFEVPHYSASANAYQGITSVYGTRYERALYFGGALRGTPNGKYFGQFFPYTVTDVYGSKVLPENIGNYEPEPINNHPPRLPADIVANADANTVVTESTASLFYHPYFPVAQLQQTVEGIKAKGFTFVPATSLK